MVPLTNNISNRKICSELKVTSFLLIEGQPIFKSSSIHKLTKLPVKCYIKLYRLDHPENLEYRHIYLGDIVGLVPDYCNEASITIK